MILWNYGIIEKYSHTYTDFCNWIGRKSFMEGYTVFAIEKYDIRQFDM